MVGIGLVATALRLAGCLDGLWLDEIWSWAIARQLEGPIDLFRNHAVDNNHPLNTLMLWALGDLTAWQIYRLPVAVFGIAAVYLGWLWAKPRGKLAQIATAVTLAVAYPLVLYGSEARGYGYAVGFAMLLLVAGDGRASRSWIWACAYAAAAVLGILSHFTFVPLLLASAVWLALEMGFRAARWTRWSAMHAIPCAFLLLYTWGFAARMEYGGGPRFDAVGLYLDTVGLLVYPLSPSWLAAFGLPLMLATGLIGLARRRDPRAVLFALGMTLPVAAAAFQVIRSSTEAPPPLFPRYFLLGLLLALLLLSEWWAAAMAHGRGARRAVIGLVGGGFLAVNLFADVRQIQVGRTNWPAAAYLIDRLTPPGAPITLAGDHDFRTSLEAGFYMRWVGRDLEYITLDRLNATDGDGWPTWLILHHAPGSPEPPATLGAGAARYGVVARFAGYGPSGAGLAVLRRADAPATVPTAP